MRWQRTTAECLFFDLIGKRRRISLLGFEAFGRLVERFGILDGYTSRPRIGRRRTAASKQDKQEHTATHAQLLHSTRNERKEKGCPAKQDSPFRT